MDWLDWILVLLVIVVIILLLLNLFGDVDNKRRSRAHKSVDHSAGGYDTHAQNALTEIEGIEPENRTANDNYRTGTIMEFNLLGGETENVPRAIIGGIAQAYLAAVERTAEVARMRHAEIEQAGMAGHVAPAHAAGGVELPTTVILDHIEDFTENNYDEFHGDGGGIGDLFTALLGATLQHAPMVREVGRETRRENAAAAADNRADAIGEYMTATATHTSDAQNVHDGQVNEDLRATLTSIERSQNSDTTIQSTIAEMSEHIMDSDLSPADRTLVFKSLEVIGKNDYIGTLQTTEGHVFKCVWDRSEDPANAENGELIKEALATALVEFWENGGDASPVCINGRCSRMLASLVLLDFDDTAGAVQTKEMIKNEVIHDAMQIINSSIDEAILSPEPNRKLVGQSYKDPRIEAPEAAENTFIAELKQKISNMMDLNYVNKLSHRDFTNVKDDIFAGL